MATLARTILLAAVLLVVACATAETTGSGKLIGRWRSESSGRKGEYMFSRDGTFNGYVATEGQVVAKFTGNWSLKNGAVLYEYTGDTMGNIAPGTKDRDRLITITSDYYVIQAADGSERKYVRVAD